MSKKENIKRMLKGDFIGEVPFSFWTHFPNIDRDPEQIAQATYKLYKEFHTDFIKTMNNGMYSTEDFGTEIDHSEVLKGGVSKLIKTPINSYSDWKDLPLLSLKIASSLQRELDYLKRLLNLVKDEVPVIVTVFSPLTTADKLSKGKIQSHLSQNDGVDLISALDKIAAVTAEFASETIRLGASGIYLASQLSTFEKLSAAQYHKYGKPFDLKVLEAAKEGWFNVLHLHGKDTMFDVVKDYPVQVINWHIGECYPGPREGQIYSGKVIMGGLNRWDISRSSYNSLHHQIYRAVYDTRGEGLILTPGCVIPQPFDSEIIDYIKQIKKETEAIIFNQKTELFENGYL